MKKIMVKKVVMGTILASLLAGVWCTQAMENPVQQDLSHQGQDLEEKGAHEIELLISNGAVSGDTNLGSGAQSNLTRDRVWSSVWASLSEVDRKQLEQHHTSQQLETVFKTLPEDSKDSADFLPTVLLALIKHDKARAADAAAKNRQNHDPLFIKSFLQVFSLGSIAIVIILCGAIRIQCGN